MRVVVKVGTSLIVKGPEGGLDRQEIKRLASDIALFRSKGHEVLLVSSGAIGAGMSRLGRETRPRALRDKQAVAAIGQLALMETYEEAFAEHRVLPAQVLLSRLDLEDRERYMNARNTLLSLLQMGVVPVINENDTVATEEIQFGDNDTLAALVAVKVEADALINLTNVDGFYAGPVGQGEFLSEVRDIPPDLWRKARGRASSEVSVGGMSSKLSAASTVMAAGIEMWIVNGRTPGILTKWLEGTAKGTRFLPKKGGLKSRKRWIAFGRRCHGVIHVDEGAARALAEGGKSLLPSGITRVSGQFRAGDAVALHGKNREELGRGLSNYASDDVRKISGAKSKDIPGLLGRDGSPEVIHRDNLVIF